MARDYKAEAATILERMATLLASPDRWTKRTSALDADGAACASLADEAVCWCLTGALDRCGFRLSGGGTLYAAYALRTAISRNASSLRPRTRDVTLNPITVTPSSRTY